MHVIRTAATIVLTIAGIGETFAEDELPLVFETDFESVGLANWAVTDPAVWRIEEHDGNHVLSQFGQSSVQTPVRSPFNRSVIRGLIVGDVQLDVDVRSTARDYPHRSLCLFFGYQDPLHFYYVHLGQRADDNANQIFIVNEAPRIKISKTTTEGTPWDDEWHHVRVIRQVSGKIEIYFDDLDTPIMTAEDTTFTWGQVGVGSFDDTGLFDNIQVRGTFVRPDRQDR